MEQYGFVLTAMATVTASLIAARALLKSKKLEQKQKAIEKNLRAIDLIIDFSVFNTIIREVDKLYENSKADKFLSLYATNGQDAFRFVTAVYEQHRGNEATMSVGATSKYVQLEVDNSYKTMLYEIEHIGIVYFDVDSMELSDLKSIYLSEKVTHAAVMFLQRIKLDDANDVLIYCSIGTHEDEGWTLQDRLEIKKCHGILRQATEKLIIKQT